jgi:uncharacterized RDD family membrane protein YckC
MYSTVIIMVLIMINIELLETFPFVYGLLGLPVMFYHLVFEVFMNGQTPGKKIQKIRVVKIDGSKPNLGSYLLRWILRPVDFLLSGSVAIIAIVIGQKGQRIGDIAAETTVIKIGKHQDFLERTLITQLPNDYDPVFHEADQLTNEHIQLIKEAIDAHLNERNGIPAASLAIKLKQILQIESNQPDLQFLTTLLKDYSYLSSKQSIF